jgi:hypothetical protein
MQNVYIFEGTAKESQKLLFSQDGYVAGLDFCKCHRKEASEKIIELLEEGVEKIIVCVERTGVETVMLVSNIVARYEAKSDRKVNVHTNCESLTKPTKPSCDCKESDKTVHAPVDSRRFPEGLDEIGNVMERILKKAAQKEIADRFEYRKPTENGVKQIELIREHCKRLALLIDTEVPNCREKSLAITKLEEVSMWANKATVFNVK